jgi:CHAT domain-containing protein
MRAFYDGMEGSKRLAPQEALVFAQQHMRAQERWRAPYYWSGYVVEGDWR